MNKAEIDDYMLHKSLKKDSKQIKDIENVTHDSYEEDLSESSGSEEEERRGEDEDEDMRY